MSLMNDALGAIGAMNPMQLITVQLSTGFTTAAGGTRTPAYAAPVTISAQVQEVRSGDLKHMNDLNISGLLRKVWSGQQLNSVDRAAQLGGDKVTLADGTIWLVVHVLEQFPGWCSVVIQKQVS
jgi:hypothetical protein